jgi:small conductance mechanosensitive channel
MSSLRCIFGAIPNIKIKRTPARISMQGTMMMTASFHSAISVLKRMITVSRLLLAFVPLAFLLAAPGSAYAASPQTATTSTASTSELEGLVQTLKDPDRRAKLIAEIDGLIAAQKQASHQVAPVAPAPPKPLALGGMLVELLSNEARSVGAGFSAIASVATVSAFARWAGQTINDPVQRLLWLEEAGTVIGVLGMAILVERGVDAGLGVVRRRLRVTPSSRLWAKGLALLGEVLLRWVPVMLFLAVGYSLLALAIAVVPQQQVARTCILAILQALALVRAVIIVATVLLDRASGGTGLFCLDERTADYWLVWLGRLVRFCVYGYFAIEAALELGMSATADAVLEKSLGLVFAGLLIMLVLQNRVGVARIIRGREPLRGASAAFSLRGRIAEIWHIAAILYIAGSYAVWVADIPGGFGFLVKASLLSAVVLIMARIAALGGTRVANRLLAVPPALGRRVPDLQGRVDRYAPILVRIARGVVYAVAGLLVMQIWGLDPMAWLASPPGLRFIGGVLIIALTIAVAVVTWEVVGFSINIYLLRPGADGAPIERSARARTLLPLFRKTMAFVLSAAVALVMLSELGVNIAPLLAGAGIIGIAVGFGAQTLVKDVITGLFILMQDAVAVGDVVTVAGSSGLVEQISIRSIRLRGLDGTVIMVPFSEVSTVHNMTKEFSYALFDIGISYREDVDEVVGVIAALAEELRADPNYRWRILEPIEVLGLDQFADSAVIIKARIKTKPIEQWNVMREYNRRLKRRFDELGVEMPFPHRTIYFGVDKKGDAPPARIVASQADELPREGPTKRAYSPVAS